MEVKRIKKAFSVHESNDVIVKLYTADYITGSYIIRKDFFLGRNAKELFTNLQKNLCMFLFSSVIGQNNVLLVL